jgi:hypothetical protein
MLQKLIIQEIQLLPESIQTEVFHFLLYLKSKHLENVSSQKVKRPYFGCGDVKVVIKPGFDEPLEDFKDYM